MYRTQPLAIRQRGAILIVSLLLLLVMTVLALTASQTTRLQERMAGNARDLDLSFQASEAALRAAEVRIDKSVAPRGGNAILCTDPQNCDAVSNEDFVSDPRIEPQTWWDTNAHALGKTLTEVSKEPQYVTRLRTKVEDSLTVGGAVQKSGTAYYVNSSRALGATETAVSVLETTYAVRY